MEQNNEEKYEDCNEKNESEKELSSKEKSETNNEIKENLSDSKKENENEKKEENEEEKKKNTEEEKTEKTNEINNSSDEEKIELSQEEIKVIEDKIISERKKAGELYKSGNYTQALNIYSLLLQDAKKAKLKEQLVILNCNKGICFNKLMEKEKALECFSQALKYNPTYSKALCNRMLLYNSKGDYLEALDDYNKLKEIDYNLWKNYSGMEYELQIKAENKKKEMTNEMLGKLKDIGNSLLGNFGISLDNFKMTPNGQGGYSIQYQNNK